MNNVPNNGEVTVSGKKSWNKTHAAQTNKVDGQQHQNQDDFSIYYSGPEESEVLASKIDAKLSSGGNYNETKFNGGY